MTLALRSPRRSALDATWCEDFKRGLLAIRKNQGTITGTPALSGKWLTFPGAATRIAYPRLGVAGATGITLACDIDGITATATNQMLVGQYDASGNQEFALYLFATGEAMIAVNISGTVRTAFSSASVFGTRSQIVATWTTGSALLVYVNGVLAMAAGAAQAGAITGFAEPLWLGMASDGDWSLNGSMADPLVDIGRAFSAAEVLAYYRRSTFV